MTTIVMTTISSTKVKPRRRRHRLSGALPLGISFAIGSLLISLAVNRKHVLPAPTGRGGIVLVAAETPFRLAGERVARNFAQQLDHFPIGAVRDFDALHQLLERLRP